jgi:hypothetical protein
MNIASIVQVHCLAENDIFCFVSPHILYKLKTVLAAGEQGARALMQTGMKHHGHHDCLCQHLAVLHY